MLRKVAGAFALILVSLQSHAALHSRASGQAYYDDVLNITWVADANLAATNNFGVKGSIGNTGWITSDGRMYRPTADAWIAAMNTANYLGLNTWRLPNTVDTGLSGCDYAYSGADCGYNVDPLTGEMAHLYYSTLGNIGGFNTNGVIQPCFDLSSGQDTLPGYPNLCATNTGPFSNLNAMPYWSGTTYAPDPGGSWSFRFSGGLQSHDGNSTILRTWAVANGDPLATPIPAAAWMFGGALGVLAAIRRRMP